MVDKVSEERRSYIMSSVGRKNTGPEMIIRRTLHHLGYRYRLHKRELPGSPDIVFKKKKKVIFIHGCFWHGHDCKYGNLPKSRRDYWGAKIAANQKRDSTNITQLRELGWDVLVIWQCQLKNMEQVEKELTNFLDTVTHK